MGFSFLFSSFEGRINRAKWWLGVCLLFVSRVIFAGIPGGLRFPGQWVRFHQLFLSIAFVAIFSLSYPLAAKRFQDRNKNGRTALFGLIPFLTSDLLGALGIFNWQANTLIDWVVAWSNLAIGVWFTIELGVLKGTKGANRFGPDPLTLNAKFQATDALKVIGSRLLAYYARTAAVIAMVAAVYSISWLFFLVPFRLLLLLPIYHSSSVDELPMPSFSLPVLLIALAEGVIGFYAGTPLARLALRVWPVSLFGDRRARDRFILVMAALSLVASITFFILTLVGVSNFSARSVEERQARHDFDATDYRDAQRLVRNQIQTDANLNWSIVRLAWSSMLLGCVITFSQAHLRAASSLNRPFAVFLRRFSGFADRSLVSDVIRSMPHGVPVAFVASRADQARNWDPFVWAFGGLRLFRPWSNLPIQIRTTDARWQRTVEELLKKTSCVLIDVSDKSPSIELERHLVERNVPKDRIIVLMNANSTAVKPSDKSESSAIRYSPKLLNAALSCLLKMGFVILILVNNAEHVFTWPLVIILPFLIMPAVSRSERMQIRSAIAAALEAKARPVRKLRRRRISP
jgi:uncharacterized membrane protein YhaH (DUF805 family)